MIVVLLGTQPHNFTRLLNYINDLVNEAIIKDEVIVQLGTNDYKFTDSKIKTYEYLPNYEHMIQTASLIISHGGVGIIMKALENKRKIIAIPREKKYKEHVDDHQYEICNNFNEHKYLSMCTNYEQLKETYLNINQYKFEDYKFNNSNFNIELNKLIDEII